MEEITSAEALGASAIHDFAVGADGMIYLAVGGGDEDDRRAVISISRQGRRSTLLRAGGEGEAGVGDARAVAVGRDDVLYVVDAEDQRVLTRSPDGRVEKIGSYAPPKSAANTAPGLDYISEMAVDVRTGDVYLASDSKIDRLSPDGELMTVAGARRDYDAELELTAGTFAVESDQSKGPGAAFRFSSLEGVAYDSIEAVLYALDYGRLIRIDPRGELEVLPRGELSFDGDITYDLEQKNLYAGAGSLTNDGVARIKPDGEALLLSGSDPAAHVADHIATDSGGNLYWLFDGTDTIDAVGDLLSELRVDLKPDR